MTTPTDEQDWTSPGLFEVAPGVYRIPLPLPNDGLKAVNAYALVDDEGLDLVDPGWALPEARERLAEALQGVDRSLADVGRFLVTHLHRDHYTQAVVLRRDFGTRVGVGRGEQESLRMLHATASTPLAAQIDLLGRSGAGPVIERIEARISRIPPLDPSEWAPPDDWLEPGPLTLRSGRRLDVVETPGHTRGHVVLHDTEARLLLAGDHVLPRITPSIGFEQSPLESPLAAFLASLALVRSMPDATLLPAHGPVTSSVHARIDELVEHHGRRLDEIEARVTAGAGTAYAIAGELRWTRRARRLDELDPFNEMLAVLETRAHLTLLVSQGRVVLTSSAGGVEHYHPPG